MNNENISQDLVSLIATLNDFILTVFAPNSDTSSHIITLWTKFQSLLHPDHYNPSDIQAFLSSLEAYCEPCSQNQTFSSHSLLDGSVGEAKEGFQAGTSSHEEILCNNQLNEDLDKKSGESTHSSNTLMTPSSGCLFKVDEDQLKTLLNNACDQCEVKTSERSGEEQSFSRGARLINEPKPLHSDESIDREGILRNELSKCPQTLAPDDFQRERKSNKEHVEQGKEKNPAEEKTSQPKCSGSLLKDSICKDSVKSLIDNKDEQIQKSKYPLALEYIARVMNKPCSAIGNYSLYGQSYVLTPKESSNSFYFSLSLVYFLFLLSGQSTSLALSTLYEKIVTKKIKLVFYEDGHSMYESLTTGLKAIIKEKIAKPRNFLALQEIFLDLFFGDYYFQQGLIACLKELLIEYVAGLDAKIFKLLFEQTNSNLAQLMEEVRTSSKEPNEAIISVFPDILEGKIEVHYVRTNKIEIVLYNQRKTKSYNPPLYSFTCVPDQKRQANTLFSSILDKDNASLLERIDIKEPVKAQKRELKTTTYFSMEPNKQEQQARKSVVQRDNRKEEDLTKELDTEAKEKDTIKIVKQVVNLDRELLLSKITEINSHMDRRSADLSTLTKIMKPIAMGKMVHLQENCDVVTPKNQPTLKYRTPFTPSIATEEFYTPYEPKNFPRIAQIIKGNDNESSSSDSNTHNDISLRDKLPGRPSFPERDSSHGLQEVLNQKERTGLDEFIAEFDKKRKGIYLGKLDPKNPPLRFGSPVYGLHTTSAGKVGNVPNSRTYNMMKSPDYYDMQRFGNNENIPVNIMNFPSSTKSNANEREKENRYISKLNMGSPVQNIPGNIYQRTNTIPNMNTEGSLLKDFIKKSPRTSSNFRKLFLGDDLY